MANIGYIRLSPTTKTVDSKEGTYFEVATLELSTDPPILTNHPAFQVGSNVTWLEGEIDGGTPFFLNIYVKENTGNERTGYLTVRGLDARGNLLGATMTITQSAPTPESKEPRLSITVPFELPHYQHNGIFQVDCENIGRLEFTDVPSWLKLTDLHDDQEIGYEVQANNGRARTAEDIEIKLFGMNGVQGNSVLFSVTQEGNKGSIIFNPSSIMANYTTEMGTVTVTPKDASVTGVGIRYLSGSGWLTLTGTPQSSTDRPFVIGYSLSENTGTAQRSAVAQVYWNSDIDGESYISEFMFRQSAHPPYINFPIWKDTDIEVLYSYEDYVSYRLVYDGKSIFEGKAYAINGRKSIRVNDIIRDYFSESLTFVNGIQDSNGYIQVELYVSENNWQTQYLHSVLNTWNDWSYDDTERSSLYNPVKDEVDFRQWFVTSYLAERGMTPLTLTIGEGEDERYYNPTEGQMVNLVVPVKDFNESGTFVYGDGEVTHRLKVTCNHKYCLYYRNVYGGYDWVLLNKASKKTDSISILSYRREIRNYTLERDTVQYQKNIKEKYTLKTDLLTDKESERMAMAVRSVDCYLQDLESGKMLPCNITSTSVEHKTYCNNSKKPFNYTIEVEVAQDRFIR